MGSKTTPGARAKKEEEKKHSTLTDRQIAFICEYIIDTNGTRAAKAAGYSEAGAAVQACKLLRLDKVQAEIKRRNALAQGSRVLSLPEVLAHLSAIATDETAAKSDRVRALELLGKRYAAFVDRSESVQDVTVDSIKSLTTDELRALIAPRDVTPE